MQGAPVGGGQRHHGGAPHGRQDLDGLVQGCPRDVHQHVFLAAADGFRVDAEEEVVDNRLILSRQRLVRNEYGLGLEDRFHLAETVRDQGAAGGDDVKDGIGDAHGRTDFHRTGDDLDLGVDPSVDQILAEDVRVGGGDAAAGEPLDAVVVLALGDGEAEPAGAEAEPCDDGDIGSALFDLVQAHDAQRGGSALDDMGNVVVAEVQGFDGEGLRFGKQLPLGSVDLDADALEEGEALFVEPAFGLDGDSKHSYLSSSNPYKKRKACFRSGQVFIENHAVMHANAKRPVLRR